MEFNKIIIGTAQISQNYGIVRKVSNFDLVEILNYSSSKGIHFIDTSNNYANAHNLIKSYKHKNKFNIIAKISFKKFNFHSLSKKIIDSEFENIFNTLGLKHIYCIMLHESSVLDHKNSNFIIDKLYGLRKQKKIKKIGISIYDISELDKYYSYNFDIIQGPFNLFDRRVKDSGWLKKINDDKKEFHARSIFLQGLLSQKSIKQIPDKFYLWKDTWNKWFDLHKKYNADPIQSSLSFVLNEMLVDSIILGIDDLSQLKQIIQLCEITKLDSDLLKEINKMKIIDDKLINPKNWKYF